LGARGISPGTQLILDQYVECAGQYPCTVHAGLGDANGLLRCQKPQEASRRRDCHILTCRLDGTSGLLFLGSRCTDLRLSKSQVERFPVEEKARGCAPDTGAVVGT